MRWCLVMILASAWVGVFPNSARAQSAPPALMPVPSTLHLLGGRLPIAATFRVGATGVADARLRGAVERAVNRLARRTGLDLAPGMAADAGTATLVISCDGPGAAIPTLDENETYSLEVTADRATLRAPTVVGAIRGLETVLQLVTGDRSGYYLPTATIQDQPRFRWRGLMIDVSRHWMPIEVVKRNLDVMAAVKLNVLHLHLSEDQGFRVESKRYPKLQGMGSDGNYFTQDQIREIVAYATARGIRVIPEFDMPGHSTSWLVGYPELGSAPGPYSIERTWGIMQPALDPTREDLYKLLDGFLGEMAALFPDAYLHIGGDENEGKQWMANPAIQSFMRQHNLSDAHALQAYFNKRVLAIVQKHGKRMIGWDEVLHPDLPKDIVVQSWRGPKALGEAARQGFSGILSWGYYIDLNYSTARHYAVDPLPADSGLSEQEAARILGGEACMWSEFVNPGNVDSRIWPRMAAIAERFWSPREVTDVDDMYRRLAVISPDLELAGSRHRTGQDLLLRNLARGGDPRALGLIVDLVEPVKDYERGQLRAQTQSTPLTRVVDTALPDSLESRRVSRAIDGLVADVPRGQLGRESLAATFASWRDVRPAIDPMVAGNPALGEIAPLADDLSALGRMGLEALAYLEGTVAPPPDWANAALARIKAAAAPRGEVAFAMLPAMRTLVAAADLRMSFQPAAAADWASKVKDRAAGK